MAGLSIQGTLGSFEQLASYPRESLLNMSANVDKLDTVEENKENSARPPPPKSTFLRFQVYLSNRPQVSMGYITIIPRARVGYEVINNQRARSASWL